MQLLSFFCPGESHTPAWDDTLGDLKMMMTIITIVMMSVSKMHSCTQMNTVYLHGPFIMKSLFFDFLSTINYYYKIVIFILNGKSYKILRHY